MNFELIHIIYLIASVTFILGLKMLSNAKTARNGNLLAAAGMGRSYHSYYCFSRR